MIKRITLTPLMFFASLLFFGVAGVREESPRTDAQGRLWNVEALLPDPVIRDLLGSLETHLQEAHRQEPVPGMALAVVREGRIIYKRGFGLRDLDTSEPVDEHTVFRLASLSKGFAPVLTGILVDEGCLHWDDRVIDYLPDFCLSEETHTRNLSLRHVLSHTTGLPRHTFSNLLNMGVPYSEILPRLAEVELAHPVGAHYNYQNVAYSLIGDVIGKSSHQSYEKGLREKVFLPLGMYDASASYEAMINGENVAMPHSPHRDGYHRVELEPNYYEVLPAAGVNASISDMAQWLRLMMGDRPDVLAPETLAEITAPFVPVSRWERNFRGWRDLEAAWYGLGWRVLDWRQRRLIYHGGYVRGYRTEIAFDPEAQIGFVLLANGPASFISDFVEQFFMLYEDKMKEEEEVM